MYGRTGLLPPPPYFIRPTRLVKTESAPPSIQTQTMPLGRPPLMKGATQRFAAGYQSPLAIYPGKPDDNMGAPPSIYTQA